MIPLYSNSAMVLKRAIENELSPPLGGPAAPYCPNPSFSNRDFYSPFELSIFSGHIFLNFYKGVPE